MSMWKYCAVLIAATMFCLAASSPVHADDPTDIIQRMEQVMRGDSSYAEMAMTIQRPRFSREMAMRAWMLGRDYSMILITAPARDAGTGYLMRQDSIWNYDPRIDRTVRLPSSMMAQSWMGSDFTNDDLVRDTDPVNDFDHELLGREEYQGREALVIRMIPKPGTPIVWGKVEMWICQDTFIQLRVENFDQQNELVNTMKLNEIRRFGDREIPSRITVIPAGKDNEQTVLEYQKIEFDIEISDRFFTQENMQRQR
ncbi:MAG: outer membrane lipoprotein-sorting protein [Desulfovibrionales bacterium]|nr:MAG: outer membrane lipoprotein-sorting protein [Desulfovibrionales bacterium]